MKTVSSCNTKLIRRTVIFTLKTYRKTQQNDKKRNETKRNETKLDQSIETYLHTLLTTFFLQIFLPFCYFVSKHENQ